MRDDVLLHVWIPARWPSSCGQKAIWAVPTVAGLLSLYSQRVRPLAFEARGTVIVLAAPAGSGLAERDFAVDTDLDRGLSWSSR